MSDRGAIHARRMLDRWRPGGGMTTDRKLSLLEEGVRYIELQIEEKKARIADLEREIVWLKKEVHTILNEAAAAAKAAHGETPRPPVVDR